VNDVLEKELTGGGPVMVKLGEKEYPLAYPMHAVLLYKQLTGDNLFQGNCWQKIAPMDDPERFMACLFAGLHVYDRQTDTWHAQLSREELGVLIDFGNVHDLCIAITRALTRFFPKAKKDAQGESKLPVPPATAGSAVLPSPNSGPAPATTSA
jgi:hypothetical protein